MEPVILLTLLASIATILGFIYIVVFGSRNLFDIISVYKKRTNDKKVNQLKGKKPSQAYEAYVRLSHEAQVGLNTHLSKSARDTLLKLYNSKPEEFNEVGITKEFIDTVTIIENVKNKLYNLREYDDVVTLAKSVLSAPPFSKNHQDYRFRVLRNELMTYYGQALMYLGDSDTAKQLFSEVILNLETDDPRKLARQKDHSLFGRRNFALGKAHSNLGYLYRKQGIYGLARHEFSAALPYFIASDQKEEIANTCDNIGRVCSLLGERAKARIFIEHGLQLRQELSIPSRIGLSINSLANISLDIENPYRAKDLAIQAVKLFESAEDKRNMGVAYITLCRAYRALGTQAMDMKLQSKQEFLGKAENAAKNAVDIFEKIVEPLMLLESYNELGSVQREIARITSDRKYIEMAKVSFTKCISLSEGNHMYDLYYVDTCDDLAQVYLLEEDFIAAKDWLKKADDIVPDEYKLIKHFDVPLAVISYWYLLGKIQLTYGYIEINAWEVLKFADDPHQILQKIAYHYAMADNYFNLFSAEKSASENIYRNLYLYLRKLKSDELDYLKLIWANNIPKMTPSDTMRSSVLIETALNPALELAEQ